MSTQAVTPDVNANPFDTPLPSEVGEHQQAVAASPTGNPFDEPLPSEKADAAHNQAVQQTHYDGSKMGSKVPNSILNGGDATGDAIAGLTGLGVAGMAADPVLPAVMAHLDKLKTLADYAGKIGFGTLGMKELHSLYREFTK
jgi:hypothetical protein